MEEHWPALQGFFLAQDDRSLANAKLELQRTEDDSTRVKRSKAGKAGALAKLKNTKDRLASAEQVLTPGENCHIAEQSRAIAEQSISEQDAENCSLEDDGQGETMKLKDELTKIAAGHGAKAGGYKTTWDEIKTLGIAYGTGSVATDFASFMEEYHGDDFPSGAVVSYLRVAADRLTACSAPAAVVSKDPMVVGLVREIAYLSDGKVTFQGRHKVMLAELLKENTPEDLLAAFKTFVEDKDLNDSYVLKYVTSNYLDAADGLCYSARKKSAERAQAEKDRAAAVARLQADAEANRKQQELERQKEQDVFDPLA